MNPNPFEATMYDSCLKLSGDRLRNVTEAVGMMFNSSDKSSFDPQTFTPCVYQPGGFNAGETREMVCDQPAVGRYVTVYMYQSGAKYGLVICELQVFGEIGEY